jgi:hypothetical protein
MPRENNLKPPASTTFELERRILGTLCSQLGTGEVPANVARILSAHTWQDPEHRVVYDALASLRRRDPHATLEQLPAEATRMGFPDVDWQPYLSSPEISDPSRLEQWAVALTAGYPETT